MKKIISAALAAAMILTTFPAMGASALSLTCPGTGGWSSMQYDDTTGNTTWHMKDGSIIVQDKNGNVIQNTQNTTSTPSVSQPTASSGWTSDTNSDFTVQPGKTYQFKFTAANPGALNVWFGTPGVFTIQKSGQEAGAVYYKITAVGTPGAAAGIYVSYNGSSGTKLCVATVAGGSSATGQPTTPEAPSKPNVDTTDMTESQRLSVEAGLTLGDWNHEYEQEVFELTNEEREKAGLPALVWAKSRTEDAQIRARELATLYSHTKPDGTAAIWENVSMAGETVAVHYENSQRILTRLAGDPKSAVQGWMNSDGHKANILHTGAVAMAVGCYVAENGNIYWVQCFTSNQNDMINPIMTNPLLEK
ncbi:CAP domain-containing protein [Anaeromassilibacillus sp. An200]|uniref:CAP domain-containing protein n=1 Tax=Anaeromassilibacillus sp. An200 TaxID=1965587 RepID=UPI0013A62066|nr:CAP domain-containing protein [Anaeromassilibacillus sp. An200]